MVLLFHIVLFISLNFHQLFSFISINIFTWTCYKLYCVLSWRSMFTLNLANKSTSEGIPFMHLVNWIGGMSLANWIPSFLGIPRNSHKFPIMQMTLANWIPSFLVISGNSQKFPTMQINSDLKSLELLGISGKGRLQFCEDLESLGIPRNSQLYKLPII